MRAAHTVRAVNTDLLHSFFAVVEHGSMNRAADRRHVSQSTLTRQMQALEHEVGGPLFERSPSGIALTATGHRLADNMRTALTAFDAALDDARKCARGQRTTLRIGYVLSAGGEYLNPALAVLRSGHPEIKVALRDLSPGEQMTALRQGKIDIALLGHAGPLVEREFYARRVATVPVMVALPETHRLTGKRSLTLKELRAEHFVGVPERDLPGQRQWIVQLARRAGFRPRFVQEAASLGELLSTVVTEGAVALLPDYSAKSPVPGVAFRPLRDPAAEMQLHVVWQRGPLAPAVKAVLSALPAEKR